MKREIGVSTIMTRNPVFVHSHTPVEDIHRIFELNNFHHLIVLDGGKVQGIISKSDYFKIQHVLTYTWSGAVSTKSVYEGMKAADIMTSQPLTIESEDTIGLAADIFLTNSFHALPIVDDGELVGIVTSHDLLAYAFKKIVVPVP